MKKILIATNKFVCGGVETTLLNILKNIDKEKFDITQGLVCKGGELELDIPADIKVQYFLPFDPMTLNKNFSNIYQMALLFCSRWLTRKLFIKDNNYDCVVEYSGNMIYYLKGFKGKKICWIHDDYFPFKIQNHIIGRIRKYRTLKYLDECYKINCVSNNLKELLYEFSEKSLHNIQFLANPVDVDKIKKLSNEIVNFEKDINIIKFISVGRLHEVKGYDRLIDICIELHNDFEDFELLIVGDGPSKKKLRDKINTHNADSYIKLLGYTDNPFKYMKYSDMYICSSMMEGYSTSISEAMIIGLGVISTDCGGSDQLLNNGEYGILTSNNKEGLKKGIRQVLENNNLVKYYSNLSKERYVELFNLDKSIRNITELF